MHREENEAINCSSCRASIGAGPSSAFHYADGECLCSECAVRRGGKYDADQERWTTPPDLDGLRVPGQ